MNGRIVLGVLLVLVLIAGAVGMATYSYQMGVAQGMADTGKLVAPAAGAAPYPYWGPMFFRPFGWGFGFIGLLFPLFFLFLIFGLVRGVFGYGRWGGHRGMWEGRAHQTFDDWHRQAHEPQGK